jgi:EAL domain-containing protein (putative c-di-GMP-specific phosphodiesterase class I)
MVVAEGVESELQPKMIKEVGCRVYQGYIYRHPQSAEKLDALNMVE